MKKYLFLAVMALLAVACKQKASDGFVIDGKLTGNVENAVVKIFDAADPTMTVVDSAVVKEGKFQLKGKVDEPTMFQLTIDLPDASLSEQERTLAYAFYVENAPMTFTADAATMPTLFYIPDRKTVNPVITGSPTQELNEKFNAQMADKENRLSELSEKQASVYYSAEERTDSIIAEAVRMESEIEALRKECNDARLDFIRKNAASIVALDQAGILVYADELTTTDVDEILKVLEASWKGKARYDLLVQQMTTKKNMALGSVIPDADFSTTDGKTVKLHDVLPKEGYALVEFWASWCSPCRAEIPHLKQIVSKYPAFHIISISVDDDDAAWKKALDQDKPSWTQLRCPDGIQGMANKVYGIMGVPACFLVDSAGKIVRVGARGPVLDMMLSQLYASNK